MSRAIPIKGRDGGTYITNKIRSQDDQKLLQLRRRRPDQQINGCCSIRKKREDEIKTTRETELKGV